MAYYGEQKGIDAERAAKTVMGILYKELGLVVAGACIRDTSLIDSRIAAIRQKLDSGFTVQEIFEHLQATGHKCVETPALNLLNPAEEKRCSI